jgi:hypothetical protein
LQRSNKLFTVKNAPCYEMLKRLRLKKKKKEEEEGRK